MKTTLATCITLTSLCGALQADTLPMPEQYLYFGGHVSQYFPDIGDHNGGDDIDDTTLPGLQIGYRSGRNWSVQAWWEHNDFSTESGAIDGDLTLWVASVRYHYADHTLFGFEPYAGIAVADLNVDVTEDNHETLVGAEFGMQRRLRPHWILDVGARPLYSGDHERVDGEAYIGLNYVFGAADNRAAHTSEKTTAPAVAAPADSDGDGDGIADSADQCPNTVAGAEVDSNGCEHDSDGDKVVDSADQCADTPSGARVDDSGCRVKLTSALKQTFYFNFASGTSALSADSSPEIERLAALLREYPDSHVTLEGHTDSQGPESLNLTLSGQRAESVRQALVDQQGISAQRVSAEGKGEAEPIGDNATAEGRASNRRVEVILDAANDQ